MSPSHPFQRIILLLAWGLIVSGLVGSGTVFKQIFQETRLKSVGAFDFASQQSHLLHQAIQHEMDMEMELANRYAESLSSGELSYAEAVLTLSKPFIEKPALQGIALAFEPYAYDCKTRRFGPYCIKDSTGKLKLIQIETFYDYTNPHIASAQWYTKALEKTTGVWIGAYYGQAADEMLIVYSVPFHAPHATRKAAGVVAVAHSATRTFKRLIQGVDLGKAGYAFLNNADRKVAYHPDANWMGVDIAAISKKLGGSLLCDALKNTIKGETITFN